MIMLLITYRCCGFVHTAADFFKIYIALFLVAQTSIGIGLFVSSLADNEIKAITIAPLFTMPNILLGGLFANSGALPSYISWAQWLSVVRYANEAVLTVLLKDVNEFTNKWLEIEGFTLGYGKCIIVLVAMCIFWRICALLALHLSIKKFQ